MVLALPPSSIHGGRKTPATLFFLLLVHLHYATILIPTTSAARPAPAPSPALTTTTRYIKSCCKTTTYARLCYATLLPYADQIKGDPKLLAGKSLSVALTTARASSSTMKRLAGLRGLSPRVKGAVGDCVRLVGDSVIQLGRSVDEMGSSGSGTIGTNFQFEVSSVQTWVSTAVTDAYTCMNEFDGEGMNGNVKIIVGRDMLKLAQLTSNALSLINSYYASSAKNKNAAAHHHQVHHP